MKENKKKRSQKEAGKKKEKEEKTETGSVMTEIKKDIFAVILFLLALLIFLGFIAKAGALGFYLDKIISLAFGWGKWLFPLAIIFIGVIILIRRRTRLRYSRIVGLVFIFFSFLGFFHLYFPEDKFLEIAESGQGGGYLGYAISWLILITTGKMAGTLVLSSVIVMGIILAFNFSLAPFFIKIWEYIKANVRFKKEIKREDTEQESMLGLEDDIDSDSVPEKEAIKTTEVNNQQKKEAVAVNKNIKSIEFIDNHPGAFSKNRNNSSSDNESSDSQGREARGEKSNINYNTYSQANKNIPQKWQFPPLDILEKTAGKPQGGNTKENAAIIAETLGHFGIQVELGDIKTGPTVTQYSFRPAEGVKLSRITALSNDLALALAAHPIRIEAPIPGKSLVGIEVPNKKVATVRLRELLYSEEFQNRKSNLTIALGKDVSGHYIFGDLGKMPHLLIAGSTGTGKSVGINSILLTLLYQNTPEDLGLILVDPKRVELSLYNNIPHLLADVIVDSRKVVNALRWAVSEMERRYRFLQDTGSRDLDSYNEKAAKGQRRKIKDEETGKEREEKIEKLPYIVIVIDELADLMAAHGKEVEGAIIRLAQMARAVGIHLIVSTQRPSVEVITGLIKANITTRIAYQVATQIDSRTILDVAGADKLLGNGDMLYISANSSKPKRIQGILTLESEVRKVVKFVKSQKGFDNSELIDEDRSEEGISGDGKLNLDSSMVPDYEEDSLFEDAKAVVLQFEKASTSFLQRRLRIGYARAARLIDSLEEKGIVGPAEGAKPRKVLVSSPQTPVPSQNSEVSQDNSNNSGEGDNDSSEIKEGEISN